MKRSVAGRRRGDLVRRAGRGDDGRHRRPHARRHHRPLRRASGDLHRRRWPDHRRSADARTVQFAGRRQAYRPARRDPAPRPHRHARPSDQPGRDRRLSGPQISPTISGPRSASPMPPRRSNAGFTTVRNVGSSNFDDVALAGGDRRRLGPGPAHRPRDLCDRRHRRPLRRHRPAALLRQEGGRR